MAKRALAPLSARWKADRAPQVTSAELPDAVDALFCHSIDAGLLDVAAKDMARREGVGDRGLLNVMYAPYRREALRAQASVADPSKSVLLDPPNPEQRGLSWRGYLLWPNMFPYFPVQAQHVVVVAAKERAQAWDPAVFADMIAYQSAAKPNTTMIFNGIAGNSQDQLHWHAVGDRLPVERALDDGLVEATTKRNDHDGRIRTFEDGYFAGILVEGTAAYVQREASALVRRLEREPPTSGKYNTVLMTPKDGRTRALLFPRRAGVLGSEFGTITIGGTMLVQGKAPVDLVQREAAARQQVVAPSELPWLDEALRRGRDPRLRLL